MPQEKRMIHITAEPITIWAFLTDHLIALKNEGYDVSCACSDKDEDLITEIEEKGISVNKVYIERSMHPVKVLKGYHALKKLFTENKYDIIVAHTPIASFISRIAAYHAGIPHIIYLAHGFPFTKEMNFLKYNFLYLLEKIAAGYSTGIICINHDDYLLAQKKEFVKNTMLREIHGIGIDYSKYSRSIKKSCNERYTVGFIGRLVKEKGIIEFLNTAKTILSKRTDVDFVIVGYGPMQEYIDRYIKKHKLEGNISCLGFRKDANNIMQDFDIFLLPTYREGLPRTVMEAMAAGIPVVTSDIRGCRQLISHGENGYLSKLRDVDSLTKNVLALLDDDKRRDEMGLISIARIRDIYDISHVIKELTKAIKELC